MPDIKRTRKGRPGKTAQRSALIVARGKDHGRDANVQVKRKELRLKPSLISELDAGDSIEDFMSRVNLNTEEYGAATSYEQSMIIDEKARRERIVGDQEQQEHLKQERQRESEEGLYTALPIPRRPAWSEDNTAQEIHDHEEEAFVSWRRGIAELEEAERRLREEKGRIAVSTSVATPFERNLEVWRQLWRTLERSDAVFLIVDSRWPDFYANPDAIAYAKSLKKRLTLVLNKADYLRPSQRAEWHRYWSKKGVNCVFFSARAEQGEIDAEAKKHRDEDEEEVIEEPVVEPEEDDAASSSSEEEEAVETRLLKREELLALGEAEARAARRDNPKVEVPVATTGEEEDAEVFKVRRHCLGMIGYPNVGKSSVLNVLRNTSVLAHGVGVRVAVSATPGKTKHLQTMIVHDELELCDCPGLVFPALVKHGAAELGCNGVVPLSKLRDGLGAAALVASRIPRFAFDLLYGTHLSRATTKANGEKAEQDFGPLSARELLEAYCTARHCVCPGSGSSDHLMAAKHLMRDYVDGKLLFCHAPPDCYDTRKFHAASIETAASLSLRPKLLIALEKSQGHTDPTLYSRHIELAFAAKAQGFLPSSTELPDAAILAPPEPPKQQVAIRQISNKSNKWHGKKNRKNREQTPYDNKATIAVDDIPL